MKMMRYAIQGIVVAIWVVALVAWFALHIAWTARELFLQDEPVQAVVTVSQSDAHGSTVYFPEREVQ